MPTEDVLSINVSENALVLICTAWFRNNCRLVMNACVNGASNGTVYCESAYKTLSAKINVLENTRYVSSKHHLLATGANAIQATTTIKPPRNVNDTQSVKESVSAIKWYALWTTSTSTVIDASAGQDTNGWTTLKLDAIATRASENVPDLTTKEKTASRIFHDRTAIDASAPCHINGWMTAGAKSLVKQDTS